MSKKKNPLLENPGYWSDISQAPKSWYITTFATHKGLRLCKRQSFSTNLAREQIHDIPGTVNISYGIIVFVGFNKDPISLGKLVYSDSLTAFSELVAHSKLVAELEPDTLELTASEPTLLH